MRTGNGPAPRSSEVPGEFWISSSNPLQQWADVHCASELQDALNLSTADGWFVSYLLPSFDSWNKSKDKTVTCVLVFPNEPSRTGSVVAQVPVTTTTATTAKG